MSSRAPSRVLSPRRHVLVALLLPELLLLLTVPHSTATQLVVVRALVGLPALLLVPGHLALFWLDRQRSGLLGRSDEVVFSAALIITLGLLLDLTHVGLHPFTWAVAVLALCLALALPVLRRADGVPGEPRGPFPWGPALLVLEFALVFGAAAWATVLTAQRAEDAHPVVALSFVPAGQQVELRVDAQYGGEQRFVLAVRHPGVAATTYPVEVRPGHPWTLDVARAPGTTARLYRAGSSLDAAPLREVQLGTAP